MVETAQCATLAIRTDHPLAEGDLVQPSSKRRCDVGATRFAFILGDRVARPVRGQSSSKVIDLHREEERGQIVVNHKDWVRGRVQPAINSMEVNKRNTLMHRAAETAVVSMLRIGASVGVAQ